MDERLEALTRLVGRQQGRFSWSQGLACGYSKSSLSRLTTRNDWREVLPGVYAAGPGGDGWQARARAALLWAGCEAALARRSTARLYELDGSWSNTVEVLAGSKRISPVPWINLVHSGVSLSDLTAHRSLRTTTATRALMDLGAVVGDDEVELALESALRKGLTSPAYLEKRLAIVGSRGRRGVARLRKVLQARGDHPATESYLETKLVQVLRRHRIDPPAKQYRISDGSRMVARVDLAWPALKLAVEADGYRWHGGRLVWKRDLGRLSDMASVGWRALHATTEDIDAPGMLVTMLRRALGAQQLDL